jgi:cytochrome P450
VTPQHLADLDLADTALHAEHDLAAVWADLRATEGLYRHRSVDGRLPFWVATRHADVHSVLRDGRTYSSERGNVLDTLLNGGDSAAGQMIVISDAPRHSQVTGIARRAFSEQNLSRVMVAVRREAKRLMAEAVERADVDFAHEVSAKIPLTAICEMMGIPPADRSYIAELTADSLSSETGAMTSDDTFSAKNEILVYFAELAAERRANPVTDDLVTLLATGEPGGDQMPLSEVIFNCFSLVVAGVETSRLAMNGAMLAFAEHPDQWRRLRDGEVAMSTAVDEILRWTTPALHAARTATRDTELAGQPIAAGEVVSVWMVSANRDERVFTQPCSFDLARSPNRHVAFSFGPHFCLGAGLARLELDAVLGEVRDLVETVDLSGKPKRIYSNFLQGYCEMPVTLRRRKTAGRGDEERTGA